MSSCLHPAHRRRCLHALFLVSFVIAAAATSAPAGESSLCIVAAPGQVAPITIDCTQVTPGVYESATVGYSTSGPPCASGDCPFGTERYEWTISASPTDPDVNSGPLPDGLVSLYLWLTCDPEDGMAGARFDLEPQGMELLAFVPLNGFVHDPNEPGFAIGVGGCPTSPLLAAELLCFRGTVAVESGTWAGVKKTYR